MKTRRHRSNMTRRPRRGLTLIEMIIAIVVMSIGVMGLAGTATYVATQMGGGSAQTLAAALSSKVADSLASRNCSALIDGSQTKRGVTVAWTVATSTRIRTITQTVTYQVKRGSTKTQSYTMVVQCPI